MITYNVERLTPNLLNELKILFKNHWDEIALYRDKIKLDPDYDAYYTADEEGILHIVVVRDQGEAIGYFISFLSPHPHYKNDLFAINDILYLNPKYRGSRVAYKMFKFAFNDLKTKGVAVILVSMKASHMFNRLCESLGMNQHDITYSIYIGD